MAHPSNAMLNSWSFHRDYGISYSRSSRTVLYSDHTQIFSSYPVHLVTCPKYNCFICVDPFFLYSIVPSGMHFKIIQFNRWNRYTDALFSFDNKKRYKKYFTDKIHLNLSFGLTKWIVKGIIERGPDLFLKVSDGFLHGLICLDGVERHVLLQTLEDSNVDAFVITDVHLQRGYNKESATKIMRCYWSNGSYSINRGLDHICNTWGDRPFTKIN